jgi:hypothetical protein
LETWGFFHDGILEEVITGLGKVIVEQNISVQIARAIQQTPYRLTAPYWATLRIDGEVSRCRCSLLRAFRNKRRKVSLLTFATVNDSAQKVSLWPWPMPM